MIFYYLVTILAQKAEKIQSFEILQNFQNFNFFQIRLGGGAVSTRAQIDFPDHEDDFAPLH